MALKRGVSVEKKVRKIEFLPKQPKALKVAAYARVSSGKEAMMDSLSAQVSYYNRYIQEHPGWLFCGVYSDAGISGTKENREGFQKLLAACRAGEVDMVITKSISRLARNTVTLLSMVRELSALGINVYFERENINSNSGEGEMILSILASFAQEESRSASENQLWRVRKNFEEGKPWTGVLLGYKIKNGQYVIVPKEAEVVRRIFSAYLDGKGYSVIAKELNDDGILTRYGEPWGFSSVQKLLKNYTYTGNLLLQKTFTENHITKKQLPNRGEQPMYHVKGAHEPIISMETFEAAQLESDRRTEHFHARKSMENYPFTGKLVCLGCGKKYRRKTTATRIVWICSTFNNKGKSACPTSKQIPEEILKAVATTVLGLDEFDEHIFNATVERIEVGTNNALRFILRTGAPVDTTWENPSRSESWTAEKREAARQKSLALKEA